MALFSFLVTGMAVCSSLRFHVWLLYLSNKEREHISTLSVLSDDVAVREGGVACPCCNCYSNWRGLWTHFPVINRNMYWRESRSVSSRELFQQFFRNLCHGFARGPPIAVEFSSCIGMKNVFCRCSWSQGMIFIFSVGSENKRLC